VLVAESPNQLVIRTEAGSSGWLVLADTWYPGWKAWVDGESTPIMRANGVFRAVRLPAGIHLVRIRYRPVAFLIGLLVSGVSGLFVTFYFVRKKSSTVL
jgi:uncharacterized membrane protein YfhO